MSDPIDSDSPVSAELAELLDALAQPPRADELVDEASTVASMQSVIAPAGPTPGASMTPTQRRLRVAALAAAGIAAIGGVTAAAPGGFDPSDRPPSFDAPPASVPPVQLPPTAARPQQTSTTAPTATSAPTTTMPATTVPPSTGVTTTTAPTTTSAVPGAIVCAEGPHGETVSSVAQATPPGPEHGPTVVIAAQSDCGKSATVEEPADLGAAGAAGESSEPGPPTDSPANTAPGRSGDRGLPADPGPPAGSPSASAPGRTNGG